MTRPSPHQDGFTLLWLLYLIVGLGIGMAALGTVWQTALQREKEAQLLFVGDQYRQAIASFSQTVPPDGQKRLPKTLKELLEDPRFPNTVRYLRRLYPDPMTGKVDWVLNKDATGGITGLHSSIDAVPLKTSNFPLALKDFEDTKSYKDWVFSANLGKDQTAAASGGAADSNTANNTDSAANPATAPAPTPPSPVTTACQTELNQALAACTDAAQNGGPVFGICRNAAVARYSQCLGGG